VEKYFYNVFGYNNYPARITEGAIAMPYWIGVSLEFQEINNDIQ
jgi:hypothetical protein